MFVADILEEERKLESLVAATSQQRALCARRDIRALVPKAEDVGVDVFVAALEENLIDDIKQQTQIDTGTQIFQVSLEIH